MQHRRLKTKQELQWRPLKLHRVGRKRLRLAHRRQDQLRKVQKFLLKRPKALRRKPVIMPRQLKQPHRHRHRRQRPVLPRQRGVPKRQPPALLMPLKAPRAPGSCAAAAAQNAVAAQTAKSEAETAMEAAEAAQAAAEQARDEAEHLVGFGVATADEAGIVKPDGKTITVTEDGTISSSGWAYGDIKMWFGDLDESGKHPLVNGVVDSRWHVCDGTDGTPDLRDRMPWGRVLPGPAETRGAAPPITTACP